MVSQLGHYLDTTWDAASHGPVPGSEAWVPASLYGTSWEVAVDDSSSILGLCHPVRDLAGAPGFSWL